MAASRLRQYLDGSYWLPRANKVLERELDKVHTRVPGALRWFPKGFNKAFEEFKGKHTGEVCYILGKGPSLDHLTAKDLKGGIVMCVNDAIKKLNMMSIKQPVYVVQQDATLREECRPTDPEHWLIVCKQSRGWYADHKNRIVVEAQACGVTAAGPTVVLCIHLAAALGCKKIMFVSFDAATSQKCEYAKVIKTLASVGGNPKRFLTHRQRMLTAIGELGLECEWLTPVAEDADTPQQLSVHPPLPGGFVLSQQSGNLQDTEEKPSDKESSHSSDQPDHSEKEQ